MTSLQINEYLSILSTAALATGDYDSDESSLLMSPCTQNASKWQYVTRPRLHGVCTML